MSVPIPKTSLIDDPSVFYRCVEDSNDTVMITDPSGVLHYVNKAWQRVYGYTAGEAVGQTPALIRSSHQDADFYQKMWAQIADPKFGYWKGELVNKAKDGREVPVFLTITPFQDKAGRLSGYMGIAVDISERKTLEAQILHQDRLAALGLISAGLAHEIGNPLGVIRGRAEYLGFLLRDDAAAQKNLDIVVSQIDRIARLMYGLLHLARGTKSEELSKVRPKFIFDKVIDLLSQQLRRHDIRIDNRLPETVAVLAEPSLFEQVVLNLLLNAVQAIEAATAEQGRSTGHSIALGAEKGDKTWSIRIADTGCGISEANLKEIFKPFFTTKAPEVGTGLGLPICDQILRGWHGSIEVKSQVNVGTTFTLTIPAA